MPDIVPVYTDKGVKPVGPYSQAIKANGLIFVSGQFPGDPASPIPKEIEGTIAEKTHRMCKNAAIVLEAAGSSLEKVVKATVFFKDLNDFKEMNEVYAQYFPQKPARSAVECSRLPLDCCLEMELIALE